MNMKTELKYSTLTEMLIAKAGVTDKGFTFIHSGKEEKYISYADFFKQATYFLAYLKKNYGLNKGSQVIIYEEDNYKFLRCFWACIVGGLIPVPLAIGGKHNHKMKFFDIWKNQDTPRLFSDERNYSRLVEFGIEMGLSEETEALKKQFINSGIEPTQFDEESPVESVPEDIGFLQYSSGSTGNPKGVVLTHDNLIYNIHDIVERIQLKSSDNALNWIPLTHDLGMIGFHLSCMLAGCNQYIMSTQLFIRRPILWMDKAHQFKASRLYSPNFGYQYFLQAYNNLKEPKDWNLSQVENIFNGAEPISARLCREFVETLEVFGVPQNCITPCYGLAEASVGVTCTSLEEPIKEYFIERNSLAIEGKASFSEKYVKDQTVSFVGAGKTFTNCYIRITGDDGAVLENGYVGHIQIKGKNVTKRYYNAPEKTENLFTADGWLKTGDLGLLLPDDSLIITGRHKNMIIIQGQNYYAHDIESLLHDIPNISLGKVVACGVSGNSREKEQLLIFVLFKRPAEKFIPVVNAVQESLSKALAIMPDAVIPVREIPKTTSGKVQHNVLLSKYLAGDFNDTILKLQEVTRNSFVNEWREIPVNLRKSVIKEWLLQQCLTIKGSQELTILPEKPLPDQGFKSVHAVQLSKLLKNQLALATNNTLLYQYPTLSKLSAWINDQLFPLAETPSELPPKTTNEVAEQILDELETMSDEEVAELLQNDEVL